MPVASKIDFDQNLVYISHLCSVFERNDGGRGGVLSTAFTTLTFRGNSSFIQNRGRGLVVSYHTQYPHSNCSHT